MTAKVVMTGNVNHILIDAPGRRPGTRKTIARFFKDLVHSTHHLGHMGVSSSGAMAAGIEGNE